MNDVCNKCGKKKAMIWKFPVHDECSCDFAKRDQEDGGLEIGGCQDSEWAIQNINRRLSEIESKIGGIKNKRYEALAQRVKQLEEIVKNNGNNGKSERTAYASKTMPEDYYKRCWELFRQRNQVTFITRAMDEIEAEVRGE